MTTDGDFWPPTLPAIGCAPITLRECDTFQQHAERCDSDLVMIQSHDLIRFCKTLRAMLPGGVA